MGQGGGNRYRLLVSEGAPCSGCCRAGCCGARVLRGPATAGGWRGLGAVVSRSVIQFLGSGMVPWEFRLARVGRTVWGAGGGPGRCRGCCRVFSLNTAGFGVCFLSLSLPPSLPATPFCLLLLPCTFTAPTRVNGLMAPSAAGCAGPGACPGGGNSSPQPPPKGLGEESRHGKRVVAPKSVEVGALHWRHNDVYEAHPLPLPSSPGQPGSHFVITWNVLEVKTEKSALLPSVKRFWGGGSVLPLAHPPDRPCWGKSPRLSYSSIISVLKADVSRLCWLWWPQMASAQWCRSWDGTCRCLEPGWAAGPIFTPSLPPAYISSACSPLGCPKDLESLPRAPLRLGNAKHPWGC